MAALHRKLSSIHVNYHPLWTHDIHAKQQLSLKIIDDVDFPIEVSYGTLAIDLALQVHWQDEIVVGQVLCGSYASHHDWRFGLFNKMGKL